VVTLRINVNRDLCDSYGVCVTAAPEVFDLDDDEKLIVLLNAPDEHLRVKVKDAAMRCPKKAISITD
jgi:ferredoxin